VQDDLDWGATKLLPRSDAHGRGLLFTPIVVDLVLRKP
jgi:hypothetical protein